MNEFNLKDFTFGEEFEQIINSQQEVAKEKLKEENTSMGRNPFEEQSFDSNSIGSNPFGDQLFESNPMGSDPFSEQTFESNSMGSNQFVEQPSESNPMGSNPFGEQPFESNPMGSNPFGEQPSDENPMEINLFVEKPFEENPMESNPFEGQSSEANPMGSSTFGESYDSMGGLAGLGQDRYINAMHAFVDYMPINLSVDRDIPSVFKSLVDVDSDLPTIVIEKLQNNMIALIHNLRKRPLPAIPTENRQPVVAWNGSIQEFMTKLEESVTFTHGFDEEEFKAMKKIIIVENMSDKKDLDQNEIYVTRQDIVDSLLNKYNSIIDLTDQNCSINFKENGKKYNFNIGGLGYSSNLDQEWAEEIRSKIVFMRNNEILLTGLAASPRIVSILKEKYGFNIVNEIDETKSLALEI